ncbi:unnamed protein product [Prunus armeniaca]|uniref:RNA-binding protein Luc7-like 2 n=1 Tax=Prunus armeniaca TaxID=36596 RepID=A0A6J5XQF6_PRUAR|nr:unnamed protein product [Prunus armeniaca]
MDALRKQLDQLMGANRNGDVREVNRKYYDREVCRLYLVGLCPHELFQLTKMDMGPCPKVHSLQLRKEYEEAKAKGTDNYDRDLEDVIDRLIVECDRKIARALKRLEDDDAKAAIAISVSEVTQTPEVLELSKQIKEKLKEVDQFDLEGKTDLKIRAMEIVDELRGKRADKQSMLLLDAFNKDRASLPQPLPNPPPLAPLPVVVPDARTQEMINEKLKKAEDLGEQGMVDEAQKALEEAEALKKLPARQEPILDSSKYTAADVRITDQKLRVCDICGAFLSVYDSDRRLADHFGGKLHLGYMQIREKLAELQHFRQSALVVFQIYRDSHNMVSSPSPPPQPPSIAPSSSLADPKPSPLPKNMQQSSNSVPKKRGIGVDPRWRSTKRTGRVAIRKRETRFARLIGLRIGDQKSEVRNATGNQVGIGNEEIAATEVGIMIVGAEIVIGIMIEIADMIASVTEIQIAPAIMIQEVAVGHAHDQGSVPGIMIATGVTIGTRSSLLWSMWQKHNLCSCLGQF